MDATAGGTLLSKTVENACTLLEDMATNIYQWSSERSSSKTVAGIHEIDNVPALQAQMHSLANVFLKFSAIGNSQSIESVATAETSQFFDDSNIEQA